MTEVNERNPEKIAQIHKEYIDAGADINPRNGDGSTPMMLAIVNDRFDTAAMLLDHRRPGRFNQAMMELGALVCTPRAPGCAAYPVADDCEALVFELTEPLQPGQTYVLPFRSKRFTDLSGNGLEPLDYAFTAAGGPGAGR